jgi:hypothetical protein
MILLKGKSVKNNHSLLSSHTLYDIQHPYSPLIPLPAIIDYIPFKARFELEGRSPSNQPPLPLWGRARDGAL